MVPSSSLVGLSVLTLIAARLTTPIHAQAPNGIPFQFEVAGSTVRGHVFRTTTAGPRPTIVELKGFEQAEGSLAPSAPAQGYTGISFDFRGQNASDGAYSPGHTQRDLAALIAFLRSDRADAEWGIDPAQMIVVGTSAGSLAALSALADDPALRCGAAVVPFNWGFAGSMIRSDAAIRSDYQQVIAGANPARVRPVPGLVAQVADSSASLDLDSIGKRLRGKVVFLLGASQDQVAPLDYNFHPLVAAVRGAGAAAVRDTLVNDSHNLTRTEAAVTDAIWRWVRADCLVAR
jgi:acetyl esterase/lipase